ncbi:MAG: DHH family phosphoesterase, partial [Clostridia bacterium]|nr:DHH family phosphoesterase [Clostridia bacterium]
MERKKWRLAQLNKDLAAEIAEKYSVDPFVALILAERGISAPDEIADFLGREQQEVDPFLLPDMQKAVDRINDAIFGFERICIYGDYDADGITSTAVLYSYLEMQGANVTYLLPDRTEDGYGLSRGVVDKIKALGTDLVITVDNGISAVEEAEYIKEQGMELIVTDHHLVGDELPDCVAVVDPHRDDCDCPFRDYCGVGVAFKLCCAIEGDSAAVTEDFIDLVALGTIADIVPLKGENRRI